jgi:hypothetical protein
VGQTLHNTCAVVPLCIGAAMGLAIICQLMGTCYQCYSVFVSTVVACSDGEVVAVDIAVAEALALRVHAVAGEGFLLLTAALLGLLFLVQSVVA